ncbi:MAG: peptidylprolyl isomerase, partial [Dolichospermum sp.]
ITQIGNSIFMANPTATLETSLGTITLELFTDVMPITAGNFIKLAKSGFYDGLHFHRVINNFMVNSSRVIVPREVSRVAVGFAMNIELPICVMVYFIASSLPNILKINKLA